MNDIVSFLAERRLVQRGYNEPLELFQMPRNTSAGFFVGVFSFLLGFGSIWYIWWLAALGLVGIAATVILRSANRDIDYYVPVSEISHDEEAYSRRIAAAQAAE